MTFSRVRAPGMWLGLTTVTEPEWEQLDDQGSKAVDGYDGGTYAPANEIIIGGDGFRVTGQFTTTGGAAMTGGVSMDALSVSGDVLIIDDLVVQDDLTIQGDAAFQLDVSITDDLTVGGTATITDADITTLEAFAAAFVDVAVAGTSTFNGTITVNETIVLAADGTLRYRVHNLDNANESVSIDDADIFQVQTTVVTGAHTYTLLDAGASTGKKVVFLNWTSYASILHNQSGSPITGAATIPVIDTLIPGKVELTWLDPGDGIDRWVVTETT